MMTGNLSQPMMVTPKPVSFLMNQGYPLDRHGGKRKEEGQDQQLIPVYQVPSYREEEASEAALEVATEVPGLPGEVQGPLMEDQSATTLRVRPHLCPTIHSEGAVSSGA